MSLRHYGNQKKPQKEDENDFSPARLSQYKEMIQNWIELFDILSVYNKAMI